MPLRVHKMPRRAGLSGDLLDHRGIVAVGDEADVLTVRLIRVHKAAFRRNAPHLALAQPAERKRQPRQLLLTKVTQHIALILCLICRLFEVKAPASVLLDAGVMPGREPVAVQLLRPVQQPVEFEIAVAVDAGVWRPSGEIARGKRRHHLRGKGILKIEHIKRDAEPPCHGAGVLGILLCTAASPAGVARRVIQPHHRPDGGVAAVHDAFCRHAAVHAAAHGDQRFHVPQWSQCPQLSQSGNTDAS